MRQSFWEISIFVLREITVVTPFDLYFTTAFVLNLTNPAPYLIKFVNFATCPGGSSGIVRLYFRQTQGLYWANASLYWANARLAPTK